MSISLDPVCAALGMIMERYHQDVEQATTMLLNMVWRNDLEIDDFAAWLVTNPREARLRADPTVVHRAVEFIEANAHVDIGIGIAEIAQAAGIGVRGLQHSFRKHRHETPMGYLRRVRLEGAHRDLLAADRDRGATVAEVASRWRFSSAGRFAGDYQRAYGWSPSVTLRSSDVPESPRSSPPLGRTRAPRRRSGSRHGPGIDAPTDAPTDAPIDASIDASIHALIAQACAAAVPVSPIAEAPWTCRRPRDPRRDACPRSAGSHARSSRSSTAPQDAPTDRDTAAKMG